MKQLIELLRAQEEREQIAILIGAVLAFLFVILGVTRFFFELRALLEDIHNKWIRPKDFKVKRTILKAIAKDNETQIVKLRTLRLFRKIESTDIDESPMGVEDGSYPEMLNQFAIPGVVYETHTHQLRVTFRDDEIPKVPEDYTYVSSVVLNATMDHLWGVPGIVASKPVGSESLTVEFFCPPGWRCRKNAMNKPVTKVYRMKVEGSDKEEDREYLPAKHITSDGGSYAFDRAIGEIDWLRVVVKKPPKDADVWVDWFWDEPTEKRYQSFKAAKAKELAQQETQTEAPPVKAEPKPLGAQQQPKTEAPPERMINQLSTFCS